MKQAYAKIVGKDGLERRVKGGVRTEPPNYESHPGLDIIDKDGKIIAWVNPDLTWLIGFTEEEETTKQ